jgi:hypothetical protein
VENCGALIYMKMKDLLMKRRILPALWRPRLFLPALLIGIASTFDGTAWADSLTVSNTDDSGAGSLRQAIADANDVAGDDTITFAPALSGQTISLSSVGDNTFGPSALLVNSNITIDGSTNKITISRNATEQPVSLRLFYVTGAGHLTLKNLTLSNGRAKGGDAYSGGAAAGLGGAIVNAGALELAGVTLIGHEAVGGWSGNSILSDSLGGGGVGW